MMAKTCSNIPLKLANIKSTYGKKKGSAFDAAITVSEDHEVITHPDGSTTGYRGKTQIVRDLGRSRHRDHGRWHWAQIHL